MREIIMDLIRAIPTRGRRSAQCSRGCAHGGAMNFRTKFVFSIGLLGLLCLIPPSSLWADDFTFSFTGTCNFSCAPPFGFTSVVTGEILGLTNNTTSAAAAVIITGAPTKLVFYPLAPLPVNVTAAPFFNTDVINSFTETNGVITAWNFFSAGGNIQINLGNPTSIPGCAPGSCNAIVESTNDGKEIVGYGSPTFAPPGSVNIPEPGTVGLMLVGIGLLLVMPKRIA
jgi:hypothetical protein